jgi:DNA-binding protein HU-beta
MTTSAKKDDLLDAIKAAAGEGCTKVAADAMLKAVLTGILNTAKDVGNIRTDIGTFKYTLKAAGTARNPKTGETVQVPARNLLSFRPAPSTRLEVEQQKPKAAAKKEATKAPATKPATKAPATKPKVVKK